MKCVKPPKDNPVLLRLDNYARQISLRSCNCCKDNGEIVRSPFHFIPPIFRLLYLTSEKPWNRLSKGSVICVWKWVHMKKLRNTRWYDFSTKPVWRSVKCKKEVAGFRAADVCLVNPGMFTETEFEMEEETYKMTNKESERDNHAATSMATQGNAQNVVPCDFFEN